MSGNLGFMKDKVKDVKKVAEEAGDGDFAPLPRGWYRVMVTQADIVAPSSGGAMAKLRLDVEGPSHVGRVVFDQIILALDNAEWGPGDDGELEPKNGSATAEKIGRERFCQLAVSSGFEEIPDDTKLFVGKTVDVLLKIEKSKEYGEQNRVAAYRLPQDIATPTNGATGKSADFDDEDVPF